MRLIGFEVVGLVRLNYFVLGGGGNNIWGRGLLVKI